MLPAELNSLLSMHPAVRSVFVTDGAGRLAQHAGDKSPADFAVDVEVLFSSVDVFSTRCFGGVKLMVLICEEGIVVARRGEDGVFGVIADDVRALGSLIHRVSSTDLLLVADGGEK